MTSGPTSSLNIRRGEKGFALIFVLFLVALLIVGGSVVFVNRLTEGKRQKEAETIWRGQQYARAIGLYYRKFGRFPTNVDDLVKQQNGIRFLRELYKNPMNKEDGSWRFIYVTPMGQLIGSVRYTSLQQMAFLDRQRQLGIANGTPGTGAAAGVPGTTTDNSSGQLPSQPLGQSTMQPGASGGSGIAPGNLPAPPGLSISAVQNGQPQNALGSLGASGGQGLQAQTGTNSGMSVNESADSSGPVIGGFIIGVAGKSDKSSIKVYKGGVTYKQWEFIFNPLEQVQTIGAVLTTPGTQQQGTSPFGMPQPPQPQPPQQPQIPQQQ
ncbi:MAG: hypothetical protein WBE21_05155 [Candidatus Acidiferrales bacterium]|jgi:hypothetical protein|nr:hypothetical protein [Candidatus Acidoferrales bacterium]